MRICSASNGRKTLHVVCLLFTKDELLSMTNGSGGVIMIDPATSGYKIPAGLHISLGCVPPNASDQLVQKCGQALLRATVDLAENGTQNILEKGGKLMGEVDYSNYSEDVDEVDEVDEHCQCDECRRRRGELPSDDDDKNDDKNDEFDLDI